VREKPAYNYLAKARPKPPAWPLTLRRNMDKFEYNLTVEMLQWDSLVDRLEYLVDYIYTLKPVLPSCKPPIGEAVPTLPFRA
jgi:hypothetical protein